MGQSSGIGVLDKAMAVLSAAAAAPVNLADLVERTGLPRATAHRLAVALEAHRLLSRLRDETGESAQLYRRDGNTRICVAAEERAHGLRDTVPVGARLPMAAGSAAHVLTAWASREEVAALLAEARFSGRTLAEVRRRGWAQSVAEREPGVASVSAPVVDANGAVVAAISVSGPIERLGRRPGLRLAAAVVAAGRALSQRL